MRIFRPLGSSEYTRPSYDLLDDNGIQTGGKYTDGHARFWLPTDPSSEAESDDSILVRSRFPGAAGNLHVRLTLSVGQNMLGEEGGQPKVRGLLDHDVVWINDVTSQNTSPPVRGELYTAESFFDATTEKLTWRFNNNESSVGSLALYDRTPGRNWKKSDDVRVVTLTVTVSPADDSGLTQVWEGLPLNSLHQCAGAPNSLFDHFTPKPSNLSQARTLPIVILKGSDLVNGLDVLKVLFSFKSSLRDALDNPKSSEADRSLEFILEGGNDGQRPLSAEYMGKADESEATKRGLKALEYLEDVSIIAAPGATFGYQEAAYTSEAGTIVNLLISHAERMRYRIAILDCGDGQTISDVRTMRSRYNSKYAALYYPWVRVSDPITRKEIYLPPSGFVAGIYARNDINRGVYKAPANEVVNLAIGFEVMLNKSEQDVLNPEGINCFRYFGRRGFRLWGARTISSDPEWKYVNMRRYFAYLERSIDRGTQWAVFEPNGEALWANVRITIYDFLFNEWKSGALLGVKPEEAFFVKCDRTTMTQNDLDNGRLICLIGVAVVKPAEYVIFRIGQWTADRKV